MDKPLLKEDGLTITVKPAKPLHLEIDLDALTFEDVVVLQKMDAAGEEEIRQALAVISRIIGQEANVLPMRHLKKVIEVVMQSINEGADQGN